MHNGVNIRELAIEHVLKTTHLQRKWVERIHDFQWEFNYHALENFKTLHIPAICTMVMKITYIDNRIAAKEKQIAALIVKRTINGNKQRRYEVGSKKYLLYRNYKLNNSDKIEECRKEVEQLKQFKLNHENKKLRKKKL